MWRTADAKISWAIAELLLALSFKRPLQSEPFKHHLPFRDPLPSKQPLRRIPRTASTLQTPSAQNTLQKTASTPHTPSLLCKNSAQQTAQGTTPALQTASATPFPYQLRPCHIVAITQKNSL